MIVLESASEHHNAPYSLETGITKVEEADLYCVPVLGPLSRVFLCAHERSRTLADEPVQREE